MLSTQRKRNGNTRTHASFHTDKTKLAARRYAVVEAKLGLQVMAGMLTAAQLSEAAAHRHPPALSGANKKPLPRGAPMQRLSPSTHTRSFSQTRNYSRAARPCSV